MVASAWACCKFVRENSPTVSAPSTWARRARGHRVPPRARGAAAELPGEGADRARRLGAMRGRWACEASARRVPRRVETGRAAPSPHPSSCRFAGPPRRHPYYGPILWLLGVLPCRDCAPPELAKKVLLFVGHPLTPILTPTTPSGRWISL